MKPHLAIAVGGYFPKFGCPMGIVLEKLRPHLEHHFDLSVISIKRAQHAAWQARDARSQRQGCITLRHGLTTIYEVTDWLNDLRIAAQASPSARRTFAILQNLFALALLESKQASWERDIHRQLRRLHRDRPFTRLLTLGFPLQVHRAAVRFKREHPDVRWVTYSTDTHYGHAFASAFPVRPVRPLVAKLHLRQELACYLGADFNFVSREIYETAQPFLSPVLRRTAPQDYILDQNVPFRGGKAYFPDRTKIHLLFAGGFAGAIRDPSYFVEVMRRLPDDSPIIWHMYVWNEPVACVDNAIREQPGRFIRHEPVSPAEIRAVMAQADILVNLGNNSSVFVPSKLLDYVSTGKPLVNVYYGSVGINPIFQRHPVTLHMQNYGNVVEDAKALLNFCVNARGQTLATGEIEQLYPEHVPQQALAGLIQSLR